jgi:hypothetical protein
MGSSRPKATANITSRQYEVPWRQGQQLEWRDKEDLGEKPELWCSRINKASLKPRQKLVMVNQYAIGRLQLYLSQVEIPQCKLLEMDLTVRRYAKQWLKLPECATDHILYEVQIRVV